MIGSTISTRSSLFALKPVRVAISAKASPSEVQHVAVESASISVFQATPQRVPPVTQPRPQIFSVDRRAWNADSENSPLLSSIAETRIRRTGKNVNTTTSDATATTLPATKASPLKKPRAASPSANSIANDATTSAAPSPTPYCPTASAGSARASAS